MQDVSPPAGCHILTQLSHFVAAQRRLGPVATHPVEIEEPAMPSHLPKFATISALATMALVLSASPARAAEPAAHDVWTVSVNAQASGQTQSGSSQSEAGTIVNGAAGLQWQHGPFSLGVSAGASGSSVKLPSVVEVVGTSAFDAGVNLGYAFGKSALTLSFASSRQSLSANVTAGAGLSGISAGSLLQLSGSVVSTSLGGGLSHEFGKGPFTVTPLVNASWDRTRTSAALSLRNRATPLALAKSSTGVSVTPEIDLAYAFSNRFALTASGAFTAASNGAASRLGTRPQAASFVQTAQQDDGAAQWGSLALGARIMPFGRIVLTPGVGTTVGRSTNEVFGSLAIATSF